MKIGDKVLCIKDYITAQPHNELLFSVGDVAIITKIEIGDYFTLVYCDDLMMQKRNEKEITDLTDDLYFLTMPEARKRKLKIINDRSN